MKILVVGGTGLIGGDAALRLADLGHDVTIAARKPAPAETGMSQLPFRQFDYVAEVSTAAWLSRFDAVVFAAGNDVRHLPADVPESEHWRRANSLAVPHFAAACKAAGVGSFILIGSFYPQAAPYLVERNDYVASRKAADDGCRQLASERFKVVVLNAPFVVGQVSGLIVPAYHGMALWALGRLPQVPRFAIPGGVNVITTRTLSDAVVGALARGRNAHAYLIGDQNLSFQDYFGLFFKAAADLAPLEVHDREHPFLPDAAIYAGRGSTVYYEPDPIEVAELDYRRNDVAAVVASIVAAVRCEPYAQSKSLEH